MTARARTMARRRVVVVRHGHRARPYVLLIGHSAPTVDLTAIDQRRRWLTPRERRLEWRYVAAIALLGLVGLAMWLARGLP